MEVDGVESSNKTRTKTEQSSSQWEVNFAFNTSDISDNYRDTGKNRLPSGFLSKENVTGDERQRIQSTLSTES